MSTDQPTTEQEQTPAAEPPLIPAKPTIHHHSRRPHQSTVRGRQLWLAALSALGVVYGDIGTSPLYALRESFHGPHAIALSALNIFGVLSLIFWSLLIVITVKYIAFILRADNRGEGGILALTALATPIRPLVMNRQRWLVLLGVLGAALLYGDGVITPAISVLSAVEGLQIATPLLAPYVIPVALTIIVALFVVQSRGTAKIGRVFGPIMLLWFVVLAILGLRNIAMAPEVLGSVNPVYAVNFFRSNGWYGFLILGTVFLVVTGGEALYADMGHFGRRPIQFAWFWLVLPGLLLNYWGQGALLLHTPEAVHNPFYLMAPAWALYPLVLLATAATIIASQALISGVFSLTMQANHLGFLPRQQIIHTSATAFGQIYIPAINWALMVGCILVVLGFRTSSNLAAAYGIAVTSTMVITTIIFGMVAQRRWHWPLYALGPVLLLFLPLDLAFWSANVVKIPNGGWFPLLLALLIFSLMTTWKRGNWLVASRERDLELSLSRLQERIREEQPVRPPGTAIFLNADPRSAPAALLANLKYNCVLHEQVLLVTIQVEDVPYVNPQQRLTLKPLGQGLYRVLVTFGYLEELNVPRALAGLTQSAEFEQPFALEDVPYFINRTHVVATHLPGMALWREYLYTAMRRNSADAANFFRLPNSRVFEINTIVEV